MIIVVVSLLFAAGLMETPWGYTILIIMGTFGGAMTGYYQVSLRSSARHAHYSLTPTPAPALSSLGAIPRKMNAFKVRAASRRAARALLVAAAHRRPPPRALRWPAAGGRPVENQAGCASSPHRREFGGRIRGRGIVW